MRSKPPSRPLICEPAIARRAVLAGLGAISVAAPLGAALRTAAPGRDRVHQLAIRDLVDDAGRATAGARTLLGSRLSLRGYFAPGLRAPVTFDLYERSTALCLLCGLIHDPGRSVAVRSATMPEALPGYTIIDVTGTLAVDENGAVTLTC